MICQKMINIQTTILLVVMGFLLISCSPASLSSADEEFLKTIPTITPSPETEGIRVASLNEMANLNYYPLPASIFDTNYGVVSNKLTQNNRLIFQKIKGYGFNNAKPINYNKTYYQVFRIKNNFNIPISGKIAWDEQNYRPSLIQNYFIKLDDEKTNKIISNDFPQTITINPGFDNYVTVAFNVPSNLITIKEGDVYAIPLKIVLNLNNSQYDTDVPQTVCPYLQTGVYVSPQEHSCSLTLEDNIQIWTFVSLGYLEKQEVPIYFFVP